MKSYIQEQKQSVIDRYILGSETSANILPDTGIPKSTFYSWLRTYREEQEATKRKTVNIRNFHLLENKVARLESIVKILKSATCTPKAPLKQRLYAAEQLYGRYSVHMTFPEEHFIAMFCATRKTTSGTSSVGKNCGFVYRKSTTKAIKSLVLPKLRQL